MKKTKKWLLCAVAALSMGLAIGATACGEKEPDNNSGSSNSEQQQVEKSIKLNVETVTIKQFDTAVLTYTLTGIPATTEIVWTSSDPSAVAVEKGKISAFKTGTVIITVTAGEYSDTVSVTVEASNDVPQLTLSQMDAKLKVGKSVTVYSDVVFRGESVDEQPEIEWSTESDAITLAPKTDGSVVITAVKPVTQAVVTAKTIYFGKEILKAVVVEVVEDTEFSISENATSLYTFTYGEDYKENITLVATVLSGGNEVSDAIVEWSTDDDTVAIVANGVVTAVGAGEATITAKYVSPSGIEHVEECIVTVSVPSIQTGKNAKIYLNSEDGDQVVNLVDDLGVTNTDLSYKVIDVATDEEMPVTVDGASFTFAITDKKLCGERAIKLVVDGKVEIQATLTVVTKVLMTAEEVANIKSYGVLEDVTDTGYTLYGYFLLGADVDLASAGELGIRNYSAGESKGFIGGFDGQGHTIANMRVIGSGLFGEIANGTVIRNTAFMGVYINSDLSGALGKNCYGVIENCLIDIGFTHGVNMGNCSGVVDSIDGEGASIRNCVVYYPSSAHKSQALSRYLLNGGSYENVAVIGTDKLVDYDNKTNTTISGVTPYAADVALSDVDFSFVTGDYWKFDGEKVYFDGYDALIKGMVSAGEYPESITNGESASLSALPADLEYVLEIADGYKDYVTLDGTTLTIANEISESFSFNISVSNWNGIDLGFSKTVNVKKIENIIVKTVSEHVLYSYSGAELVENSGNFVVDLSSELTADIPSALTWKAYSGTTELANVTDYLTISGKTISVSTATLISAGFLGEIKLVGESADGNYKLTLPVCIVTASITKAEELTAFASASQTGYYVLGANINASGLTLNNAQATFTGTFDGRGYAIDGATYSTPDTNNEAGGLFGAIAAESIIKNVALTNSKILAHPYIYFGVMTGGATSLGTITDCFVEIVEAKSNVDGYNLMNMTSGLVGNAGGGAITNVIVKYGDGVGVKNAITEMVHSGTQISNTYVIGGTCNRNNGWVDTATSSASITNVTSLSAEQQATFNVDVWAFDESGNPSFKKKNA